DPGVVHQDVEDPVLLLDVLGGGAHALLVGHVEPDVRLAEPLGGGAAALLVARAHDRGDAELAQPAGDLVADALVGSGDECSRHGSHAGPAAAAAGETA